jgi:predicted thioredoxin/glutaredoxin
MFVITEELCQNCKMLKQMLGENAMRVQFVKASENMELCRELGIKTIPALVKDDNTVVFDLGEIVSEVEKAL